MKEVLGVDEPSWCFWARNILVISRAHFLQQNEYTSIVKYNTAEIVYTLLYFYIFIHFFLPLHNISWLEESNKFSPPAANKVSSHF